MFSGKFIRSVVILVRIGARFYFSISNFDLPIYEVVAIRTSANNRSHTLSRLPIAAVSS